jgi:hypothetical protein
MIGVKKDAKSGVSMGRLEVSPERRKREAEKR